MNSRFVPNTNKINPKFDGYKLQPFSEATNLTRSLFVENEIQLYNEASIADHRLGFRDLQARIRHSRLSYGFPLDEFRGTSYFIDQQYNLVMVVFGKRDKRVAYYTITQIVKPLGDIPSYAEPGSNVPIESQIPSVFALSHDLVLTCNGVGDIELIGIEEKNGTILGTSLASVCYLGTGTEGISPVPCMLLTARQIIKENKIIIVVYSRSESKNTEFNIATLALDLPTENTECLEDGSFVLLLKTLHIQKGPEVPTYYAITPSGKKVILGSETRYNRSDMIVAEEDEPVPMEIVEECSKNAPYQWSQEGADITVVFSLPSDTSKDAVSCKFLDDHISLLVQVEESNFITYPYRKLWSTIRPNDSMWTLDTSTDTLTLYITKVDENTRWPQLFDNDDGVLETLSTNSLEHIKSRMSKFHSELPDQDLPGVTDMSMVTQQQVEPNPSFVQAAQHPAATDLDEDIDDAGQPIVFSVYNLDGMVVDEFSSGTCRWICHSYITQNHHTMPSICLQMDVDGLIFAFTESPDSEKIHITHIATLDAFAFVQASKRDGRFIHHDPNLHFASIIESSRNAYVYYHHEDKRVFEAQTLVDLTKGEDVDVIGAQMILPNTLLVMTESQLVAIELL